MAYEKGWRKLVESCQPTRVSLCGTVSFVQDPHGIRDVGGIATVPVFGAHVHPAGPSAVRVLQTDVDRLLPDLG